MPNILLYDFNKNNILILSGLPNTGPQYAIRDRVIPGRI